ncbi:MAG: 5-formyltetrahydrofolate cyclo-ligase [bacterium]
MKTDLRKAILARRDLLTIQEITAKSFKIKGRLFDLAEFKESAFVCFYVSFKSEVQTHQMIKETLMLNKKVAVPIVERNKSLSLCELKDFDKELEVGKFGILESKLEYRRPVDLSKVKLVIVPGVVFDKNGNRIGYGGGYYDNLLSKMCGIPFIGLAYELQIVNDVPAEDRDIPVHKIITENRVINRT